VRQVYPADLALSRRPYERWLDAYPFTEHRRLQRSALRVEPWRHTTRGGLSGVRRQAWKRLGIPLGWCAPRQSLALAVRNEADNRLLIAEYMTAGEADESVCVAAIEGMNECASVECRVSNRESRR
jgi:hypothetical protein